jgi:hypothetical protein
MARNLPTNLFRDVSDGQVDGVGRICEELTTYETREVVAVPNSRSRGGV